MSQKKTGTDVVLLRGCPQSYMPNPVEGLCELYEDMVEVLLVLEMLVTKIIGIFCPVNHEYEQFFLESGIFVIYMMSLSDKNIKFSVKTV